MALVLPKIGVGATKKPKIGCVTGLYRSISLLSVSKQLCRMINSKKVDD